MTETPAIRFAGLTVLAQFTLQNVNVAIACATGLCGLVIVLPRAIRTIRRTNWKSLFTPRRR